MSQPNNLPTLNQYLGPGGHFPQTIPAYSTVPEQKNQPHHLPPHGNWNQAPQQGNWNQAPQQGNWNQGPQQGNWSQAPQQGNWNNQGGYPNWNQGYNNFSNEIYNLRNQYGMQIPDNQIDQTLDAAKANKRMYAFPEPEKTFIRYDEKGKSYILSSHSFRWTHKDNNQYFADKNDPDSYDGTTAHLIKVCWLDIKLNLKHVKPGNYQLFIHQAFENVQIRGQMKLKVLVGDKEVFNDASFPNAEMVKNKKLTETFICNIKREDFDMNKLDNNGDAIVRVEFGGNNNSWKKGWSLDGIRLLETN